MAGGQQPYRHDQDKSRTNNAKPLIYLGLGLAALKSRREHEPRRLKGLMVVGTDCFLIWIVSHGIRSVVSFGLQEANRRTVSRLVSRKNQASALSTLPLWTQVQHYYGFAHHELGRVD
ncbi:hypothetical protein KCV03_g146, partial [Aureobasidium melanogenum]